MWWAALVSVVERRRGFLAVKFDDGDWIRSSREERWFTEGERLAREYFEVEDGDGVLVDRAGNLRFPVAGWRAR